MIQCHHTTIRNLSFSRNKCHYGKKNRMTGNVISFIFTFIIFDHSVIKLAKFCVPDHTLTACTQSSLSHCWLASLFVNQQQHSYKQQRQNNYQKQRRITVSVVCSTFLLCVSTQWHFATFAGKVSEFVRVRVRKAPARAVFAAADNFQRKSWGQGSSESKS